MALFKPGIAIGEISGRVGGSVFSHNAGGMYVRNGTIPINKITPYRAMVKQVFGACSIAWTNQTVASRAAWTAFSPSLPWKNRLGATIKLSGQACFIHLNSKILEVNGTPISVPPVTPAPNSIQGGAFVADIGAGNFQFSWTGGATGAHDKIVFRGCVVPRATIVNIENRLRIFDVSAATPTSPLDLKTAFVARFGTLQVGEVITIEVRVTDASTGLQSAPDRYVATVTSTP